MLSTGRPCHVPPSCRFCMNIRVSRIKVVWEHLEATLAQGPVESESWTSILHDASMSNRACQTLIKGFSSIPLHHRPKHLEIPRSTMDAANNIGFDFSNHARNQFLGDRLGSALPKGMSSVSISTMFVSLNFLRRLSHFDGYDDRRRQVWRRKHGRTGGRVSGS